MTTAARTDYRELLDARLWDRVVARISHEDNLPVAVAEQTLDAALGFLKLCADYPERRFSPTEAVDVGWHGLLMYTAGYTEFCRSIAGRFIHHEPNDNPAVAMATGGAPETVRFMKEHGIVFDEAMWASASADCDGGSGPTNPCSGPLGQCTCS